MKSPLTTLCYMEKDGKYLMLYRNKKENDVNEGKWIGIGGHFEEGESPDECLLREVYEETGLRLTSYRFRGMVTFCADGFTLAAMELKKAQAENAAKNGAMQNVQITTNSISEDHPEYASSLLNQIKSCEDCVSAAMNSAEE